MPDKDLASLAVLKKKISAYMDQWQPQLAAMSERMRTISPQADAMNRVAVALENLQAQQAAELQTTFAKLQPLLDSYMSSIRLPPSLADAAHIERIHMPIQHTNPSPGRHHTTSDCQHEETIADLQRELDELRQWIRRIDNRMAPLWVDKPDDGNWPSPN